MEGFVPHLIFYAAAAGVALAGYRAFTRAARQVSERGRMREAEARNGAAGTLERDPHTGRYRVKREA